MSNCTPLLSLSDIRKFVELVDSNAGAKHFSKLLGLSLDQVKMHLTNLDYYRRYIVTADTIEKIRNDSSLSTKQKLTKIAEARNKLNDKT